MWTTLHAQIVLCHLKLCLWLELWTVVLLCTLLSDVRLTCGICCSVISEHVLSHPCIVLRRQCQVSTSYKCKASASARRIWQTWGGAVTDMCNTPLIVWLYLAYSRQLKLTASLNADGILKNLDFRRVSGWSLLDGHMWSPCGLSSIAYSMWVNDRLALQTRSSEAWTATHQWILFMTQTDDDMKDKLSKNIFDPHLESGDP